ncbi:MAG: tetratricopeptide repeat protein [Candidatus Edwardsbacteria bacterium]
MLKKEWIVFLVFWCFLTVSSVQAATPEDLVREGMAAEASGDYQMAIDFFKEAISLKPKYGEAHYRLGEVYAQSGMTQEAISELKEALRFKYEPLQVRLALGLAYYKGGMFEEAEREYNEILKQTPNNPLIYYSLGDVYLQKGAYDQATNAYRQALQLDPNFAKAHKGLGNLFHRQRMFNEAISEFKQAIELEPNLADTYSDLGSLYFEMGRYPESVASLERYVELRPKDAVGHFILAKAYDAQKETQKALTAIRKSVELNIRGGEAYGIYYFYAKLATDLKLCDEAMTAYERVLEIDPSDPNIWEKLGKVCTEKGISVTDTAKAHQACRKAVEAYCKAMEIDTTRTRDLLFKISLVYYTMGNYEKSIETFTKVIEINPSAAGAYINRALAYSARGTELSKSNKNTADEYYYKAIADFEKGLKIKPDYLQAWNWLGDHYDFMGTTEKAIKAYKEVINRAPESKEAQEATKKIQDIRKRKTKPPTPVW